MNSCDIMTKYIASFIDELEKSGVSDVVISPGSRSTPLAMLMVEHPKIKTWIQIDERSAGYFALGIARMQKKAVALICTSGTAVANFMPSIVEAHYQKVPLIVLSTDRPYELRDIGAPQAIDQIGIYGKYAKWFVEMPLAEDSEKSLDYVRVVANRAVVTAMADCGGVVHLNFPFRDPLIPNLELKDLWSGQRGEDPYTQVVQAKRKIGNHELEFIAEKLKDKEKGIIICGSEVSDELRTGILKLAESLKYPILADPLANLRCGPHSKEWVLDSYDALLRNDKLKTRLKPEVVLRFGAMPVSKAVLLYLENAKLSEHIVIDENSDWRDPTLKASHMIYSNEAEFCKELVGILAKRQISKWAKLWQKMNQLASRHMIGEGSKSKGCEGRVMIELQKVLPEKSTVFLANSMPIRDADYFFTSTDKEIKFLANRGTNGIDGVISTSLGASTVIGPLVLVIGDLSFFHDSNALYLAKRYNLDITIILVNNDGGGIFSFLPQAKHGKHFEELFGTPMGLDYEHVVKMYQGSFKRIRSWDEFGENVKASVTSKGLSVIEVPFKREENEKVHCEIWSSLMPKVEQELKNNEY